MSDVGDIRENWRSPALGSSITRYHPLAKFRSGSASGPALAVGEAIGTQSRRSPPCGGCLLCWTGRHGALFGSFCLRLLDAFLTHKLLGCFPKLLPDIAP